MDIVVWITMVEYRRAYDGIIMESMIKNDKNGQYSFTDIYGMIKKSGYPNVGKDTVQRHLNRLVKWQMLVRLPKEGRRYNKTLYVLSPLAIMEVIISVQKTT